MLRRFRVDDGRNAPVVTKVEQGQHVLGLVYQCAAVAFLSVTRQHVGNGGTRRIDGYIELSGICSIVDTDGRIVKTATKLTLAVVDEGVLCLADIYETRCVQLLQFRKTASSIDDDLPRGR